MSRDGPPQVNPTLLVRVQYRVSIPGRGTVTGSLAPEQDPELCRALASVAGPDGEVSIDFDPQTLARLMELGAVTEPHGTPQEVQYQSLLSSGPPGGDREAARTEEAWGPGRCLVGSLATAPVDTRDLDLVGPDPDPRRPILWVEDPRTTLWFPYWIDPQTAERLAAALGTGRGPSGLDPGLRSELATAGAVAMGTGDGSGAGEPAAQGWRESFGRDGYVVLPELLSPSRLDTLRRYASDLHRQGFFWLHDGQVEGREFIHNEPLMGFFNRQLAGLVSSIVGEAAKPSYTYLTRYNAGSELARHVDRSQCRWNISLVLDQAPAGAEPWPLFIEVDGAAREVRLRPGDAVLFLGSTHPHWRPALPAGATAVVALLHFVAEAFAGDLR